MNEILELTAQVVSAFVGNNSVRPSDLPDIIANVHIALAKAENGGKAEPVAEPMPALAVRRSITPDHLVCFEDGKKFKSLRRHLSTHYNLTPEEYRAKWGLPVDYPMVAPSYAATRSDLAKAMGLGRRPS